MTINEDGLIVLMVGVNGVGKNDIDRKARTSIRKKLGKKVMLAAEIRSVQARLTSCKYGATV